MASESRARIGPATAADLPALEALLGANGLPVVGFAEHIGSALVARLEGRPAGCACVELYGTDALLRSVATGAAVRGSGIGQALVREALALARGRGARRVWLLTTTAQGFFPRFGFRSVARDDVPQAMLRSAEFSGACPSTAVLMRLDLAPADRDAMKA